jgi:hypothetical protein
MVREGNEVLGRRYSNLWLLTLVLVATFISIAFSEGGMIYLRDKMEDPFTNWIDIPTDGSDQSKKNFLDVIRQPAIQRQYGFTEVCEDVEKYNDMNGVHGRDFYANTRHVSKINSPLVHKILHKENLVKKCVADGSCFSNRSLGVILTSATVERLGYSLDSIPAYINYKAFNPEAVSLGVEMIDQSFAAVPVPVLAVVRRLPGNSDILSTKYLAEQIENNVTYPFSYVYNEDYLKTLIYFVPEEITDTELLDAVKGALPADLKEHAELLSLEIKSMRTWQAGRQLQVGFKLPDVTLPTQEWLDIDREVLQTLADKGLTRIYNYKTSEFHIIPNHYSLTFTSLDHVREFEMFAKGKEYKVQIDMTQVASKENFNAVSLVARILSSAMVVFSIVCIIMFLVNMLQAYFQKVKRNIGTFKAFGMNATELIKVYVIILIMIVGMAISLALAFTWLIQLLLPLIGFTKDGFNYLSLWNPTTYIATSIIAVSTVITVCCVMIKMLQRTPGDLIYDRE